VLLKKKKGVLSEHTMVEAPPVQPTRTSRRQAGLPPLYSQNPTIQDNQVLPTGNNQVPALSQNAVPNNHFFAQPHHLNHHQDGHFRDPMVETASLSQLSMQSSNPPSHISHQPSSNTIRDNMVETASLSQFTLPNPINADHTSMRFENPTLQLPQRNQTGHPATYNHYYVPSRPPSVSSSSMHSGSTVQHSSHGESLTSSSAFLKAQIHHLMEEKRSSEYKMNQIMQQMVHSQRLTADHMQQSQSQINTLIAQLNDSQSENRRLMQMILQKESTKTAKSADIRDLMDIRSHSSVQASIPSEINLLDLNPMRIDSAPLSQPHPTSVPIQSNLVVPNNLTHIDKPTPRIPSPVANECSNTNIQHESTPPTQLDTSKLQSQAPIVPTQEALLQQLITVSQIQTKVLTEKSDSTPQDLRFPKFNGKQKEFDGWYNQILSILSTPKWSSLYDFQEQDVIDEDLASPALSQNLYSKLVLCLSDDAEKVMRTKHHLRGQGIKFLQTIKSTFKRTLTSTELMKLESDFARPQRKHNESITSFAARCIQTRSDLSAHGIEISDERLCHRFIHGLGPLFTDVCTNLKNMPNWHTTSMDQLIIEATDHEHTVLAIREHNKLFKKQPKDSPNAPPAANQYQLDVKRKTAITKAIEAGTFKPSDYTAQVNGQNCVYHNTNHPTTSCDHIGHLVQSNHQQHYKHGPYPRIQNPSAPSPAPAPPPAPAARQVHMEPLPEVNLTDLLEDNEKNDLDQLESILKNNIVNNVNPYGITCKHIKLCDPTNSPSTQQHPKQQIQFVIDSGAYPHMCNTLACFSQFSERLLPGMKNVVLADGVTTAPIKGIGSMEFWVDKHMYRLHNVIYVPQLSHSLFSIKEHCKWKGCYFHAENNMATIAFPTFTTSVQIKEEIYLAVTPIIHAEILQHAPKHEQQLFATAKTIKTILPDLAPSDTLQPKTAHPLLKFKLLHESAHPPTRGTPESAGLDLYASQSVLLPPKTRAKIPTCLAIQIPTGCYGRIAPRSGMSIDNGIDIGAGVIDPDYRGEVTPVLINNGSEDFQIQKGDRISQLLLEKYTIATLQQVANLNDTLRGEKGFRSTSESLHSSPPHQISLKLNQLKFNKKITIKLPSMSHFTKGRIKSNDNNYEYTPTNEDTKYILTRAQVKNLLTTNKLKFGHHHLITIPDAASSTNHDPLKPVLRRTVDIPLATAPQKAIYSTDQLRKYFGFRNVNTIIKELKQTATNFGISTLESEPILDIGDIATIDKPQRNTSPLPLPINPGDVIHADILFGSGPAIGGAKYALFLVDRASRHKYIYPIQNLKEDILPSFIKFFNDIGRTPNLIRTDFDHKLMGKVVENHLNLIKCKL